MFQEAVDHVRAERLTGHMLAAFVERYRSAAPQISAPLKRLQISLAQGTVRVADRDIVLSGREFELLVFLALRNSPASTEVLTEALWPESDADRARSSLKVTLSRSRSRLGDNPMIVAKQNGYALAVERALDIGSCLNHAQISEVMPPRIQLDAARQRVSRWGWAKTFDGRIAALEVATLPNGGTI